MQRDRPAFFLDETLSRRLTAWAVLLVALPLALFAWWVYLQAPSRTAQLSPVTGVSVWLEPIGQPVFNQASLERITRTPPDWGSAQWQPVTLPHFQELPASIDLPPDAPKQRAWFRIPIPPTADAHGRLALLGSRILSGGPWALWVDGRLQQLNLADWRIQWNVPLRLTLPLGAREVYLAVPFAQPQGFSVGSLWVGPVDVVDAAWQERNVLHLELPRFMVALAFLLMLVSFQLARARPQEPMFMLLGFNALVWSISGLQFAFDPTGQDTLSLWFGSIVDSSITWMVVLSTIFAFEFESIRVPRLRVVMLVYAVVSTLLTLPLWEWQKNALIAQQNINMFLYLLCLTVLGYHVWKHPRREGVVMWLAFLAQVALGLHTLQNLTNQTNPDSFYSFPLGTLTMYLAFMYALSRRTVAALAVAEQHEGELRRRLAEQQAHLAGQHARLQKLELERGLSQQHQTIMQDLHDRLGSNLTSALLQARAGALSPTETVLLLQDLTDELRHIGKSTASDQRGMAHILAELRQRVQGRLAQGGIALEWAVDPTLPAMAGPQIGQHLRALLSEAIANVIKHARASRIRLEAERQGDQVVITVADNGQGFDPAQVEAGRGLPGMRQRAAALGGALEIGPGAGGDGTAWRLSLPVVAAAG